MLLFFCGGGKGCKWRTCLFYFFNASGAYILEFLKCPIQMRLTMKEEQIDQIFEGMYRMLCLYDI